MSIAHATRFTRHAWAMPPLPGFPSGVWSASNSDEGDETGGIMSFQHIFRNTSNNLGDTALYNIEHLMCASTNAGVAACQLDIRNMDPGVGDTASIRPINRLYRYDMPTNDTGGLFRSNITPREGTTPVWVGTYNGVDTNLGDVIVSVQNVGGATRVSVAMYGYYWAPSAVNAAAGIQRPPNGLWRS